MMRTVPLTCSPGRPGSPFSPRAPGGPFSEDQDKQVDTKQELTLQQLYVRTWQVSYQPLCPEWSSLGVPDCPTVQDLPLIPAFLEDLPLPEETEEKHEDAGSTQVCLRVNDHSPLLLVLPSLLFPHEDPVYPEEENKG